MLHSFDMLAAASACACAQRLLTGSSWCSNPDFCTHPLSPSPLRPTFTPTPTLFIAAHRACACAQSTGRLLVVQLPRPLHSPTFTLSIATSLHPHTHTFYSSSPRLCLRPQSTEKLLVVQQPRPLHSPTFTLFIAYTLLPPYTPSPAPPSQLPVPAPAPTAFALGLRA